MDTWKLTGGSLPAGLSLAAGSGSHLGNTDGRGHLALHRPGQRRQHAELPDRHRVAIDHGRPRRDERPPHRFAQPCAVPPRGDVHRDSVTEHAGQRNPTGKVTFSDNGAPIRCAGGSQTLDSGGVATCTIPYSASGTHSATATYMGNANFTGSQSQTLSETVRHGHHPWARRLGRAHRQRRSWMRRSRSADGRDRGWMTPPRVPEGATTCCPTGSQSARRRCRSPAQSA
jgi:hypothetical protein